MQCPRQLFVRAVASSKIQGIQRPLPTVPLEAARERRCARSHPKSLSNIRKCDRADQLYTVSPRQRTRLGLAPTTRFLLEILGLTAPNQPRNPVFSQRVILADDSARDRAFPKLTRLCLSQK